MRKVLILVGSELALLLLISTISNAQVSVKGTVVDGNGQPLDNASVLLLHSKDSMLVKGCVTGKNGTYTFDKITTASYLIVTTFSGYKDAYSTLCRVDKKDIAIPVLKIVE